MCTKLGLSYHMSQVATPNTTTTTDTVLHSSQERKRLNLRKKNLKEMRNSSHMKESFEIYPPLDTAQNQMSARHVAAMNKPVPSLTGVGGPIFGCCCCCFCKEIFYKYIIS